MKRLLRDRRGFTLAEVLVGVAILTVATSIIGAAMFQAFAFHRVVADQGLAINELQKGLGWIAEDVMMATSTDLVDGGPPVSSAILSWTDRFDGAAVTHVSRYDLVGGRLVRTHDGTAHTVARRVVSVAFSRSNRTVTAQIETDSGAGTTRMLSVTALMRTDTG